MLSAERPLSNSYRKLTLLSFFAGSLLFSLSCANAHGAPKQTQKVAKKMFNAIRSFGFQAKLLRLTLSSYDWAVMYSILDRITPELADEIGLWAFRDGGAAQGLKADVAEYLRLMRMHGGIIANLKTLQMQNLSFYRAGWFNIITALFYMLAYRLPETVAVCRKCEDGEAVARLEKLIESGRKIYPTLLAFANQHTPQGCEALDSNGWTSRDPKICRGSARGKPDGAMCSASELAE